MPGNLPHVFNSTTYAIIDGTEVYIQTPTDWSEYKHTFLLLVRPMVLCVMFHPFMWARRQTDENFWIP